MNEETKAKSHPSRFPTSGVDIPKAFLEKLIDPFIGPEYGYHSRPEVVKAAIREFHERHRAELPPARE